MKIDLDKLDLKELKKLRKDVDRAISDYDERLKSEARSKLEEEARKLGFTLAELTGTAKRRSKSPPKYRNPDNAAETWTGKGRKPNWVVAALDKGKKLEDLLIK